MAISFDQYMQKVGNMMNSKYSYVFRGQSDVNWSLKTSYARFYRKIYGTNINFSLDKYENMLSAFIDQISEYYGRNYEDMPEYQLIALSQHYGIPSPFLDWTMSPYIALYFALKDCISNNYNGDVTVCVYCMNTTEFDRLGYTLSKKDNNLIKSESKYKFIKTINFYSRRVKSQQGCFMYINNDEDLNTEESRINEYIEAIEIQGDPGMILKNLLIMGINGCALYDELEYLCEDIVVQSIINK
ncbi:MAG: FRG domain-containing protein [Bacteroidetes bacterium]|nr:FRG domain-containing protein [Bacteroidota bacterium]